MGHRLKPQFLEPCRIGGGVANGVVNVAVPQEVLNEAGVRALVGESKTAGMAQHVGMHGHRQPSLLAVLVQQQVDGRAVQGLASLTEEERPPWCLQPRSLHQPGLERVISISLECDLHYGYS